MRVSIGQSIIGLNAMHPKGEFNYNTSKNFPIKTYLVNPCSHFKHD